MNRPEFQRAAAAHPSKTICAADVPDSLAMNAVHIWRIPLPAPGVDARDFGDLLTPTEQVRSLRFTRQQDQCRFQLGRAAIRCILARYLGLSPTTLDLAIDRLGKPHLEVSTLPIDDRIHFNLSHSGDWILAAFARSLAVGIDLEAIRSHAVTADLIEYFMSEGEQRTLRSLPPRAQAGAFFKCWTSKEALLKGLGVGLGVALRAIEVSIDPDEPAQLITAPPGLGAGGWQLLTLAQGAPYAATLAIAAQPAEILDITLAHWRDIHGA